MPDSNFAGPLIYAASWLLFGLLHSVLARASVQRYVETFIGCYYRITYNLIAAIKITLVFYIGSVWLSHDIFSPLNNDFTYIITTGLRLLGVIVFVLALSMYDLGRFSGITQLVSGERTSSASNEPLQRQFLNRWVRHPLYTAAFFLLWGGATSTLGLWTAIWGTIYLIIGTLFEERKLVRIYGNDYRIYQREVPRYFPALILKSIR